MQGFTVALAVTGSIAAYKAVEVARLLVRSGARVLPVMSASAQRFIGPVTLSGICSEPVTTDMWDPTFAGEVHVALAARADVMAIVPATADVLARLAQGRADDVVTALALSARGPIVCAPAMHPRMWTHPATRANVEALARQGRVMLIGPVEGLVASGESGVGRMAEPPAVVEAIVRTLGPRDLAGVRVVVSAGPTIEDLDPVRFLGNRSSGKMGFAIAERAAARGAVVTLVAGPVSLDTPPGVRRVDVRSTLDMKEALEHAVGSDLSGADAVVMSAAVADYRPRETSATKTKKKGKSEIIELVKNPDLLGDLGARRAALGGGTKHRRKPLLVGFAVETGTHEELVAYARAKLAQKQCDLVVANEARHAFGGDTNAATVVGAGADDVERIDPMSKRMLADRILHVVRERLV
jgi:phosphopantothenoylcysteine decarboxylase/phosphopantothenate--cysteine ligase